VPLRRGSVRPAEFLQGAALMVRRHAFEQVGGFDERFFMYGEDIDLSRRIYEVAEAMYVPQAQVIHEYRRYSKRSWRGTWIGIQNNARYFNKWGWLLDRRREEINRRVRHELERLQDAGRRQHLSR
jgi:GT2 family glycosyltransferase